MLKKVLVIGSGPIIIGQAAEFDYSGTQACRVLKEAGIEVVLVNNNPATIMTDKSVAHIVYSEPLTLEVLERIIDQERPEGILSSVGGQTALNLTVKLDQNNILSKYGVKVLGTSVEMIQNAEDRSKFKNMMTGIGQPCLNSYIAHDLETAKAFVDKIGYPVVVRPAYTLGGTGGGFCNNIHGLKEIVLRGVHNSPTGQVLIEKSIQGWKEIEYEMIRDKKGNTIAVCNMENFDPVGIHTGDSIVVAPSQTLSDQQYQMLRRASIDIVSSLNIIGACNVQLALDPYSNDYYVIEVNPRVSRSSALASKATGYPIAKVATKIALGYDLEEIVNDVTQKTKACFEPSLDYCAIKIPKWPFNKFKDASKKLGTQMQATGEIMAIGPNFESALLKGIRSLEINQEGLVYKKASKLTLSELFSKMNYGDDERLFYIADLLRREVSPLKIQKMTSIALFFIHKIQNIVNIEKELSRLSMKSISKDRMILLKQLGFSDQHIGNLLLDGSMEKVRDFRKGLKIIPSYKMVDTCAGEFPATSPYYYSTYDLYSEATISEVKKIIIVGSGPITIGQGVEFDYCSVHGVFSIQKMGYEAILINNNPETVSTDFDVADKLYFEPLTLEDVLNVVELEKPEGVILQYGGQTAIKLAEGLDRYGVKILGTNYDGINRCENRGKFNDLMSKMKVDQPMGSQVYDLESAICETNQIGFPILMRPSYVIGGEGMKIYYDKEAMVADWSKKDFESVLIDAFHEGIEIEVDCISDGEDVLIPGIMEHIESAGIHSGDSTSVYPPQRLSMALKERLLFTTKKICQGINGLGLINIQYVYHKEILYVIEVNPRASRTVPFLSKVTGLPIIDICTQVILGKKLKELNYGIDLYKEKDFVAIKSPVFSMEKISNGDIALGPLMKSTGEMLSIDRSFEYAMKKSMIGKGMKCGYRGIFLSVSEEKKHQCLGIVALLKEMKFKIYATKGTHDYILDKGFESVCLDKLSESDEITRLIQSRTIDMIINIPGQNQNSASDGFKIRRLAIESGLACFTSLETIEAKLKVLTYKIEAKDLQLIDLCKIQ